ncbi:M48 family metallopeptidase [Streptomyces sp. NRRL S-350]|uniref:M48 family metallopeptidase n=1 Tax=Streptomyces sp. NRRL S-350 TaxID=1463902 RepID=UPI0004C20EDA|nr:M48 family metalloprotease [Streptomyces sp. NRRL S-350]
MPALGRQLAATTLRFVLLLTLLLTASVSMTKLTLAEFGLVRPYAVICTGVAETDGFTLVKDIGNGPEQAVFDSAKNCVEQQAIALPWWVIPAAVLLVLGTTAALFAILPRWKARRGRVLPLAAIDRDGQVAGMIAELVAQTGLRSPPTVLVDVTALSASAVVFGRTGRPRLCLNGGLLARQRTDPQGVRAVLLHELGHIDNRDVTLTYATVALWRSFVLVVLAPAVVGLLYTSFRWPHAIAPQRTMLAAALMVLLIYLSRSDLLRTREFHADLAALRWGADPRGWSAESAVRAGRGRRVLVRFGRLWRNHPDWESRRQVLADPDLLSRIPPLAMFLTGAVLVLVDAQVWVSTSLAIPVVLVAPLATGVMTSLVWPAVESALRTGSGRPQGLRAGLWLGLGMSVAEFVSNRVALSSWLPQQPLLLLLLFLAGIALTWWITQCCYLWAAAWPGRSLRPAKWIAFIGGLVAVTSWLLWWRSAGIILAHSLPLTLSQVMEQAAPGGVGPERLLPYESVLPAYAVYIWLVTSMSIEVVPLSQVAIAASWGIAFVAWLVRPRPVPVTDAPPNPGPALVSGPTPEEGVVALAPVTPSRPTSLFRLRRLLLPAGAGSLVCWAAVAATMGAMHGALQSGRMDGLRATRFSMAYQGWAAFALLGAAVLSAVVASMLAGRSQLVAAVIAGQLTVLGGSVGVLALVAVDGCVGPLTLFHASCGWHPRQAWAAWGWLLGWIQVSALIAAVPTAGLVAGARAVIARWRPDRPAVLDEPGRARMVARRAVVAVVVLVTLVLAGAREAAFSTGSSTAQPGPSASSAPSGSPGSPRLTSVEVEVWHSSGGDSLATRFNSAYGQLALATADMSARKPGADGGVEIDEARFRPVCESIGTIAADAGRYDAIPDPQAEANWQSFIEHATRVGRNCPHSFDTDDSQLFLASLHDADLAAADLTAALQRVRDIKRASAG